MFKLAAFSEKIRKICLKVEHCQDCCEAYDYPLYPMVGWSGGPLSSI